MRLITIADVSGDRLEHALYWELEESDYSLLDVSDECMAVVRRLHDPLFLGKALPVAKKFEEGSQLPVYYISNKWPYIAAPVSSVLNGRTGEETAAVKPDPDFVTWNANVDRINAWHGRLSRNLRAMCGMYWDSGFKKLNRNAAYEVKDGRLVQVGASVSECKEKETEEAPKEPEAPKAPVTQVQETANPSEWAWKYSEVPFPETMQQIEKLITPLKRRGAKKYGWDFGKYVFNHPSSEPSLGRAIAVIKKYHLFAIARALVLRSRDIKFPWQYVYNSTLESLRGNSRMDEYRSIIRDEAEHGREVDRLEIDRASDDIVAYYRRYMEGNVTNDSGKFSDITGRPWDIKHFIIELRENLHIDLKKLGKTTKKEGQ